ncbi:methionyl-tRNA formyltransferase [Patescibacteria group bacterium]
MNKVSVVFFGSFLHYSTKIAKALHESPAIDLLGVVSTPPMPAGRKKVLKKTHTHLWAEENNISVFTPEELYENSPESQKVPNADFFVVAGYSKLLTKDWLNFPKIASINLHFSLLPDYRGANPAEWAILLGETETGVSMIVMGDEYDTGKIITRKTYTISEDATRETLYEPLYDLAAEIVRETLPNCQDVSFALPQEEPNKPEARKFNRANGFIDWQFISDAINGKFPENPKDLLSTQLKQAWQYLDENPSESDGIITPEVFLERSVRALSGFPGVWTYLPTKDGKKRLKILSTRFEDNKLLLDQVQLEGKEPSSFNQIKNQIK